MLDRGVGDTGGARAGTAGQGGARVRMTGHSWVGAGESGPEVGAEGAGPEGLNANLSGSKFGDGDGDEVVGSSLK